MLSDDVLDLDGQLGLLCHDQTVAGMRGDDGGTDVGIGMLMRIFADLVFLEIQGTLELADVVEVSAGAGQEGIAVNRFGGGFRQVGHNDGMVVGAGSFNEQAAQKRMVGVAEFQQLRGRGQVEDALQQRIQRNAQNCGKQRASAAVQRIGEDLAHGGVGHESNGKDDDHIGKGRNDAGKEHLLTERLALDDMNGKQAADEGSKENVDHGCAIGAVAAGDEGADQNAHGKAGRHGGVGADQAGHHHGSEQHGRKVAVHQTTQNAKPHGDAHDDAEDYELSGTAERIAVQQQHADQQHGHGQKHQQHAAQIHHHVHVVIVQQAEAAKHG